VHEAVVYIPGHPHEDAGPLGRYLPPIAGGVARAWLVQNLPPGSWVLDPFGASPALAVEMARAGYRLLIAANNPIARFLLEIYAAPFTEAQLRAALADLAASQKGNERIEPHIRSLYRTECSQCGEKIEARAFVWERDAKTPSGKIYDCPYCKASGEFPASQADGERASRLAASSALHRARALERVTPLDDPDREHVEEALATYLPRAVYALFTLVNKLESFPIEKRRPLQALLLAALDQTNVLWAHPTTRARPRQLSVPPRYLEKNAWLALDEAVKAWTQRLPLPDSAGVDLPLVSWPQELPSSGGLCLFEGRLKDLVDHIQAGHQLNIAATLTALPRPNQAYWTLSALWAGWLWGYEASAPFKSVLRRRRYDWSWHTLALHAAFRRLVEVLPADAPCLGLIGELEPGFLTAAMLSACAANFDLDGLALRAESAQAQIHWRIGKPETALRKPEEPLTVQDLAQICARAAQDYLRQRGEPAPYIHLHAAALSGLNQVGKPVMSEGKSILDLVHNFEAALDATFAYQAGLARFGTSGRSAPRSREIGLWWLDQTIEAAIAGRIRLPLADRVEMEVVRHLQRCDSCTLEDVDQRLCTEFAALLTPELELIQACLDSYAERLAGQAGETSPEPGVWKLRPQDFPQSRRADLASMRLLLENIGARLGFQVEILSAPGRDEAVPPRAPLVWKEPDGRIVYRFYLQASAVLGSSIFPSQAPRRFDPEGAPQLPVKDLIVVPGGRAGLIGYKLQRDPRLQAALEVGWRFLKFRHIRWLAENDNLERSNLDEQLDLDPLSNRDPQMPLL
jgi:hypothetical protein